MQCFFPLDKQLQKKNSKKKNKENVKKTAED